MKTWIVAITLSVIVFLVSLSWYLYRENKILEKEKIELQSKVEDCHLDNANGVIEKELLYKNLGELNTTLNNQTKLIKSLTETLTELKSEPIRIRAIPCDEDVLAPYMSESADSRGF